MSNSMQKRYNGYNYLNCLDVPNVKLFRDFGPFQNCFTFPNPIVDKCIWIVYKHMHFDLNASRHAHMSIWWGNQKNRIKQVTYTMDPK